MKLKSFFVADYSVVMTSEVIWLTEATSEVKYFVSTNGKRSAFAEYIAADRYFCDMVDLSTAETGALQTVH